MNAQDILTSIFQVSLFTGFAVIGLQEVSRQLRLWTERMPAVKPFNSDEKHRVTEPTVLMGGGGGSGWLDIQLQSSFPVPNYIIPVTHDTLLDMWVSEDSMTQTNQYALRNSEVKLTDVETTEIMKDTNEPIQADTEAPSPKPQDRVEILVRQYKADVEQMTDEKLRELAKAMGIRVNKRWGRLTIITNIARVLETSPFWSSWASLKNLSAKH